MAVIENAKAVGGTIFNFKIGRWLAYDTIIGTYRTTINLAKSLFMRQEISEEVKDESFEDAMQRLDLTEEDLATRKIEFTRSIMIFLLFSALIFGYSVMIAYSNKNYGGFAMGLAITAYSLSNAFRYHFWLYQIKKRKLGASFKEWLNDR